MRIEENEWIKQNAYSDICVLSKALSNNIQLLSFQPIKSLCLLIIIELASLTIESQNDKQISIN